MVALAKISAAFGFGFKHLSSVEQFSAILALLLYRLLQQEKTACVQTIFCLSCEAGARHMFWLFRRRRRRKPFLYLCHFLKHC